MNKLIILYQIILILVSMEVIVFIGAASHWGLNFENRETLIGYIVACLWMATFLMGLIFLLLRKSEAGNVQGSLFVGFSILSTIAALSILISLLQMELEFSGLTIIVVLELLSLASAGTIIVVNLLTKKKGLT